MVKKLLIWDSGEKQGETLCDTQYLPDYEVLRLPLPISIEDFAVMRIGEPNQVHVTKYAICKRSKIKVGDKLVYLCNLE